MYYIPPLLSCAEDEEEKYTWLFIISVPLCVAIVGVAITDQLLKTRMIRGDG